MRWDTASHTLFQCQSYKCGTPIDTYLVCRACGRLGVISDERRFFGRPFVKRFTLCYRSVVLSCLSVTFVHCGQTVGQIKMKLGVQVGLGPGHIVLDGNPAPLFQRGTAPTQFSAHICCGQMAACIKMPLGMELGLSPRDFVRWGPSPP